MCLEFVGVLLSLISVYFITKQNNIGWIFSALSTLPLILFFYNQSLYLDLILQILFFFQAFRAWKMWNTNNKVSKINNYYLIIILFILSIFCGWIFNNYIIYSYVTIFGFIFYLYANWNLINKKIESWLIFIFIDILYIGLYGYLGFYYLVFLYVIYMLIAINAYIKWKKDLRVV